MYLSMGKYNRTRKYDNLLGNLNAVIRTCRQWSVMLRDS